MRRQRHVISVYSGNSTNYNQQGVNVRDDGTTPAVGFAAVESSRGLTVGCSGIPRPEGMAQTVDGGGRVVDYSEFIPIILTDSILALASTFFRIDGTVNY